MITLDAVLHDALDQSERAHGHLVAPAVRRAIARKRIARRAALSSVATVGAVGLGAGSYAAVAGLLRSDGVMVVDPSVSTSISGSPSPVATPSPSASPTLTPTPTPTPTPSVTESATSSPSEESTPRAPIETPLPELQPTPTYASQAEFCQHVPLMIAQADAAGLSSSQVGVGSTGSPSTGVLCTVPRGFSVITYTWSGSGRAGVTSDCVDTSGTMTFTHFQTNPTSPFQSRWADACFNGIHMKAYEAIESGDFALTDEQFQDWASKSVEMSGEAWWFAP